MEKRISDEKNSIVFEFFSFILSWIKKENLWRSSMWILSERMNDRKKGNEMLSILFPHKKKNRKQKDVSGFINHVFFKSIYLSKTRYDNFYQWKTCVFFVLLLGQDVTTTTDDSMNKPSLCVCVCFTSNMIWVDDLDTQTQNIFYRSSCWKNISIHCPPFFWSIYRFFPPPPHQKKCSW